MNTRNDQQVQIEMMRQEAQVLFVQVLQDGAFQRLGARDLRTSDGVLVKGHLKPDATRRLFEAIPDDFRETAGHYNDPDATGDRMGLSIILRRNGTEEVFQMVYGSQSTGPTQEIKDFVITAIQLTEPAYQAHL
ncbi:hypothetical protein ACOTTU_02870 [Roseobacter sp. EG26]|uniref:hypothetical protein n=1 Tax=Roseobacter sp. EG26 TaxID=3412477 RepID=UPI003CE5672C